jgi:hypothetical protein
MDATMGRAGRCANSPGPGLHLIPGGDVSERTCRKCDEVKPLDRFKRDKGCADGHRRTCMDCDNTRGRNRYHSQSHVRDGYLTRSRRYKYGVGPDHIDALYNAQGGLCGICAQPIPRNKFDVDHCHTTGEVRGLLHRRCNLIAGFFDDTEDAVARVLAYLKHPTSRKVAS